MQLLNSESKTQIRRPQRSPEGNRLIPIDMRADINSRIVHKIVLDQISNLGNPRSPTYNLHRMNFILTKRSLLYSLI